MKTTLSKNLLKIQTYLSKDLDVRSHKLADMRNKFFNYDIVDSELRNLYPYNQLGFHPLNPLFITYVKNRDPNFFLELPFVLCADSAPRLYKYFQEHKPVEDSPILLVRLDLAPLVPEYWKEKVCFFSVGVKARKKKLSQLLVHGVINYDLYDKDTIDEIVNLDYDQKLFYLSVRSEEYGAGQEQAILSKIIPKLLEKNEKKVKFINQKQAKSLEGLASTEVREIGNRLLSLSYDLFEDELFSNGAVPSNIVEQKHTPDLTVPISFFHHVCIYDSKKIKMGGDLERIDTQLIHEHKTEDYFATNFIKDNYSFTYHL